MQCVGALQDEEAKAGEAGEREKGKYDLFSGSAEMSATIGYVLVKHNTNKCTTTNLPEVSQERLSRSLCRFRQPECIEASKPGCRSVPLSP